MDTWFGEVVCVCVCVHTCAALDVKGTRTVWMLKCLNFHKTSKFSMHRGLKYVKSILFWKFVMSICHTSFWLGFSVFGLNVFIFSYKYPSILLTFPLKCFASSSSLILACPFKSKLRWPGIMERLQGSGARQNEAGILAWLYTGPKSFGHICVSVKCRSYGRSS